MRSFFTLVVVLAAVTGCGKKTGAPGGATDKDRLQGVWAVESKDDGDPEDFGTRAESKNDRLTVEGDTFTIGTRSGDETFTFTLDETKNPKVITLTGVLTGPGPGKNVAAEPEKLEWIYKFEGETLVLAIAHRESDAKSPRPTEFKAAASRFELNKPPVLGVSVITLKRTDVPAPPRSAPSFATRPGTRK